MFIVTEYAALNKSNYAGARMLFPSNALLQFCLELERCKPNIIQRNVT